MVIRGRKTQRISSLNAPGTFRFQLWNDQCFACLYGNGHRFALLYVHITGFNLVCSPRQCSGTYTQVVMSSSYFRSSTGINQGTQLIPCSLIDHSDNNDVHCVFRCYCKIFYCYSVGISLGSGSCSIPGIPLVINSLYFA